jgi:hypothetical protein
LRVMGLPHVAEIVCAFKISRINSEDVDRVVDVLGGL